MKTVLVTGPSGYLGYHVIKLLNQRGISPRALWRGGNREVTKAEAELMKLNRDDFKGSVDDLPSLQAACRGVDTVLHMNFVLNAGSGQEVEKALYEGNVVGTRNVLNAATKEGVARVVVSSSAMTVGINPEAKPLDETADWATCAFNLPYALSRREAERESLERPNGPELPTIVAVNPSLTMGPDDYVGAPTNKLVKRMAGGWFRFTAPIGMSVLDVRDFADGVLRAAQSGQHGRRYILSGVNLSPDKLIREVAAVCGNRPPRFLLPVSKRMSWPLVTAYELMSKAIGKSPKVTRSLLHLWGRYGWYDATRARQELGWQPRPLRDTLSDTIRWLSVK